MGTAFAIKDNNKNQETVVYTNDTHSVFSLEDCVKIAVEKNIVIYHCYYNNYFDN